MGHDFIPTERIENKIFLIRGKKVMLDSDLAQQLTKVEFETLRSQIVISKNGRGGRRYSPYVYTEHGVAMLSSVLRSKRAITIHFGVNLR